MTPQISEKTVLEELKNALENGYNGMYQDLLAEIFNDTSDERFTDENMAKDVIEKFGIQRAQAVINSYRQEEGGATCLIQKDVVEMADILWYIVAERTVNETFVKKPEGFATEVQNKKLVAKIKQKLAE